MASIEYSETPLRAVFNAPSGPAASSTSTAAQSAASDSMSMRDVSEPISSSPVTSSVTPSTAWTPWVSASAAMACTACASPTTMSKQPGPRITPSAMAKGWVSKVPIGHTVSW